MIGCWVAVAGLGVGLISYAVKDSLVYYISPSELIEHEVSQQRTWRVGGLVKQIAMTPVGHINRYDFQITDYDHAIRVVYRGIAPVLFREDQGVVAEGTWEHGPIFKAQRLLIKHDENYRPPQKISQPVKDKSSKLNDHLRAR